MDKILFSCMLTILASSAMAAASGGGSGSSSGGGAAGGAGGGRESTSSSRSHGSRWRKVVGEEWRKATPAELEAEREIKEREKLAAEAAYSGKDGKKWVSEGGDWKRSSLAGGVTAPSGSLEEADYRGVGGSRKPKLDESADFSARNIATSSIERAVRENLYASKRKRTAKEDAKLRESIRLSSEEAYRIRKDAVTGAEVPPPASEAARTEGWVREGKEWVKRRPGGGASASAAGGAGTAPSSGS
jgi:hypothetical protein